MPPVRKWTLRLHGHDIRLAIRQPGEERRINPQMRGHQRRRSK